MPVFGFQAAAYTSFATLMYMGYRGYFLKEYKKEALVNYYPLIWLNVTIGALLTTLYLSESSPGNKLILTTCVGIVALLFARKYKVI